jgi:hypothetical protein
MIYELAAIPQAATDAFAKSLYAFLLTATKGKDTPSEVTAKLRKWGVAALPFATRFKLISFSGVYKNAVKPAEKFDQDKLKELGVELKTAFDMLHKEHDINSDTLKLIKIAGLWFRTKSDGAYKALEKRVSMLDEPALNSAFLNQVSSQKPIEKQLQVIVKKLTGKDGTIIDSEHRDAAKKKNPALYKEYVHLRNSFNEVWKTTLKNYVRSSGKKTVPYLDIVELFKKKGIKHPMPPGFTGNIDDTGKWYTKEGKLIDGVPSSHVFPVIKMNPEYDASKDNGHVFTAWKANGRTRAHKYTVDYNKTSTVTKFVNVDELKTKIKGMRNKWLPMVKAGIVKPEGIAATELEVIFQFNARVGTPNRKNLGVSTILIKNVFPQSNGNIKLMYFGKDGIKFTHILEKANPFHLPVIKNIKALMEGRKPMDLLWAFKKTNGKYVPITAILVNKLWKQVGGGDTGVHKMRTLRGTILFKTRMDEKMPALLKRKTPLTEKEAREVFNKLAEEVGKELGHMRTMAAGGTKITGATAIKSYIDPSVLVSFFSQLKMRLPPFLEKFGK